MIDALRAAVPFEEFDYQTLLEGLRGYASPRDRATRLLKAGAIIRVKKGLYVFGPTYRRAPFSIEVLANLASGPSYISFHYALGHYNLIPEQVTAVTSATLGKARTFDTPLGRLSYRPVPGHVFWLGVTLAEASRGRTFLIATPEKALCDTVVSARKLSAASSRALRMALADDLRLDMARLTMLDAGVVADLAARWPSRRLARLAEVIAHE